MYIEYIIILTYSLYKIMQIKELFEEASRLRKNISEILGKV